MRGLDQFENVFGSQTYAPTPFDSHDFEYPHLSHPYFTKIRNDKRLTHFYSKSPGTNNLNHIDFSIAISMREYLRDLFPHGQESADYQNANVLEMLDAAEQGEKFLCGDISKMLVQLIQAGGTQARIVGLRGPVGHVILEMWSDQFNKWVVLDPDFNVHYTNANGIPLSALDLYTMSQDRDKVETIKRLTGDSQNTLHNSDTKLIEKYYKNGFSIFFYNRWVDKNLPRIHPARSPSIMGYYVGESVLQKFYYKHNSELLNDEIKRILYQQP